MTVKSSTITLLELEQERGMSSSKSSFMDSTNHLSRAGMRSDATFVEEVTLRPPAAFPPFTALVKERESVGGKIVCRYRSNQDLPEHEVGNGRTRIRPRTDRMLEPPTSRGRSQTWSPSHTRALHSGLVGNEVQNWGRKTCPVGDTREQRLDGLVLLAVEILLSDLQDVGNIGHAYALLHTKQAMRPSWYRCARASYQS